MNGGFRLIAHRLIFQALITVYLLTPCLLCAGIEWSSEIPGGFNATVHIPKTSLTIDENLEINLWLEFPKSYQPDIDTIRKNLLKYIGVTEPPFALAQESVANTSDNKMHLKFVLEPQIAQISFLSFYQIPFIPLEKDNHDRKHIISEIFEIEVELADVSPSFKGNPIGLLSLTNPLPLEISRENIDRISSSDLIQKEVNRSQTIVNRRTFPFSQLLGILLFFVIFSMIRMQPVRHSDIEKTMHKKAANAHNKALNVLQVLDLTKKEEFYNEITNTVRTYIEEKYQLQSTKQTTQEFLSNITTHPLFDYETQVKLSDFLLSADRVKFAKHTPSERECLKAKKIAEQLIQLHIER